jgi:uncharacterized protein (TIGR00645 family)
MGLRLYETSTLWADVLGDSMEAFLTIRTHFAAAHRLARPELSAEQNDAIYGKCARPHGHGHNYLLEVTVRGPIDPRTGMVCDLAALQALVSSIGYKADAPITALNETVIMLVVLALIDVVMISNLLIMVIVGGYETFVSRLNLEDHPDQPEWLDHVNASVLKVKLGTAIIGISSIHLLKTFINAANYTEQVLMWQTIIHIAFLLSAIAIAYADRLMSHHDKAAH